MNSIQSCTMSSSIILKHLFRDKIIKCLNKYEIPRKLIKLIARTLQDTKARVKVHQNQTEKFEISTRVKQGDPLSATLFSMGVKQGDPLSATLYSIAIDEILKQLEMRGNISTRLTF